MRRLRSMHRFPSATFRVAIRFASIRKAEFQWWARPAGLPEAAVRREAATDILPANREKRNAKLHGGTSCMT